MDVEHGRTDVAMAALTAAAGLATVAAMVIWRGQLPALEEWNRPTGFVVLCSGMALYLWASRHLRAAMGGAVSPRLERLVVTGPFRLVRHPTYLGLVIAMIGVGVMASSAVGLAMVALLFLPTQICRARLEERALQEAFGPTWREYAARTGFMLPRLRRI